MRQRKNILDMRKKLFNMSRFHYLILLFLIIINISCAQSIRWINNEEINSIQFKKIRYSCNDSDTISIIGFMNYNNIIQGYPCKKGWVHFTKEKDLKLFCLSETHEVENIMLPVGCWIIDTQNDNFTTVVFPNDTIIQGFPVSGGGGVKGARTRFYKSGKLKSFFPSKDFISNDTKFKKSIFHSVKILSDGSLIQD
jgi:hypothetical protein